MSDDANSPFDPKRLQASPELITEWQASESVKSKKRRKQNGPFAHRRKPGFITLPVDWIEALKQAEPHPPWGVALYLVQRFVRERDKNGNRLRTLVVSNDALGAWQVSRFAKMRELQIIEAVGLIQIEPLRPGQSPRVTWLVDPEG